MTPSVPMSPDPAVDRYLDLLAQVLTRYAWIEDELVDLIATNWKRPFVAGLRRWLGRRGYRLVGPKNPADVVATRERRRFGDDWPPTAETMVGLERLANVRELTERILDAGTPGDFLEAGVWRGGTTIYMRALLACYGVQNRTVWVADSFEGLPPPGSARLTVDNEFDFGNQELLRVGLATVKRNFERYGLLDDQVQFIEGWFADTLPSAPVERLAMLRLDADLYESTWQILTALYDRVVSGGFVIIDDYLLDPCRAAVTEFREREGITAPIVTIDPSSVYWQRD